LVLAETSGIKPEVSFFNDDPQSFGRRVGRVVRGAVRPFAASSTPSRLPDQPAQGNAAL